MTYAVNLSGATLCTFFSCIQHYYSKKYLNNISLGQSKEDVSSYFPDRGFEALGFQMRAAKRAENGKLIEVGELFLNDQTSPVVAYWLLFENGILVQFGQPEDWQKVSARYDINFNPLPGVKGE